MRRQQKILVTALWGVAVLAMLAVVGTGMRRDHEPLDVLWNAPKFSLTDQHGKTVTDADLKGNVWIGMLFFTNCPGVCPMMTGRMTQLQKAVTAPDVKIVSFSVDPEHDTPEMMRAYAERSGVDQSRWHMLTGPASAMFQTAMDLKLPAAPALAGQPIMHSQKVLLIDRKNRVRRQYDTNDDDQMKQLAEDAKTLAAETGGPL